MDIDSKTQKWLIMPPYDGLWIAPFVPNKNYLFESVGPPEMIGDWHIKNQLTSGLKSWWIYWRQTQQAWRKPKNGVITVFPQLAATVAFNKKITGSKTPIIAWSFNLGRLYGGLKHQLAKFFLKTIDVFIVHSKAEIKQYSQWLDIPEDRFYFVPVQSGIIPKLADENTSEPFLVSVGSANRDYSTLFKVVEQLKIKTIVIAAPHAVQHLIVPSCVTVKCGLTREECQVLTQQARLVVIPIHNQQTASGQVTLVEAMRMGRPVIATRCIGTEDYMLNNENGVFVEPGSVDDLSIAIKSLWNDSKRRESLGERAYIYAETNFSDEACGKKLGEILDQIKRT